MAAGQIPRVTDSLLSYDDAATAGAIVKRDDNGDIYCRRVKASGGADNSGGRKDGYASKTVSFSTDTTVVTYLCDPTTGAANIVATLVTAVNNAGLIHEFIKTDATATYSVTVTGSAAQTIGGAAVFNVILLNPGDRLVVRSDGANWQILYQSPNLIVSTAASSAVTAAAETTFDTTGQVLPVSVFRKGDVVDFELQGIVSTYSSGTDTVKLKLNSAIIASTGAITPSGNDIFHVRGTLNVRANGGSGTLTGSGSFSFGTAGTATEKAWYYAPTAFDTTALQTMTVTNTFSAGSNSARLDHMNFVLRR